jgi:sigma-B regulation protein RsbU (phosphoserine phosphatase)
MERTIKRTASQRLRGTIRGSLSTRFVLLVVAILATTLGGLAVWSSHAQQELLQANLLERARAIGRFVSLISPEEIFSMDFDNLNNFTREISQQKDMVYAVIFDPKQNPLTSHLERQHPLIAEVLKQQPKADLADIIAVLRKHPSVSHLEFPIAGFQLNESLGTVIIGVDSTAIEQAARRNLRVQAFGILAVIVFLIAAIYLVFRFSVLRPVNALVDGAERIGAGVLDQPVQVYGQDELGILSRVFNRMMLSLQEALREKDNAMRQLRELNASLEQRVAQRTAELAAANDKILQLNENLQAENVRMSAELNVARRLQQMVLPRPEELSSIRELDITGFMEPASEVGGDYFDVLQHKHEIKIGIGDVTGHGLESGVLMLMVQMAIRTLTYTGQNDLKTVMRVLNHAVFESVKRMNMSKSLTLALLDYSDGRLRITGQHEEMLLARCNGEIERIDTFDLGFLVGLMADIDHLVSQTEVHLEPGDGVVLYTDGITEAQNSRGEMYGVERLCEVVSRHWQNPAATVQAAIIADVRVHIGATEIRDDLTLLVMKRLRQADVDAADKAEALSGEPEEAA